MRGAVGSDSIARMRKAVDGELASPVATATEYVSDGGSGRFYGDFFIWLHNDCFAALMRSPEIAGLAADFMPSNEVYFFYDHLLVKEPDTAEATPLHQDLPYWPLAGEQIISIWIPLDPVSEESGAVSYIAGSHRWGKMFAPQGFAEDSGFSEQYAEMALEPPPDLEEVLETHRQLSWDVEPGDVIVHHPLTLHYAPGNRSSDTRRRAIALRYVGEETRYSDRPGTFIQNPKLRSIAESIALRDGDPLRGELFPRVWP